MVVIGKIVGGVRIFWWQNSEKVKSKNNNKMLFINQ
jgi:hypothetical protein